MENLDIDATNAELKRAFGWNIEVTGEHMHAEAVIRTLRLSIELHMWGEAASSDPDKVVSFIRGYLSPIPDVGQTVIIRGTGGIEFNARVVSVDCDKHIFSAETLDDGRKCGPYRFGDMMYIWRRA